MRPRNESADHVLRGVEGAHGARLAIAVPDEADPLADDGYNAEDWLRMAQANMRARRAR